MNKTHNKIEILYEDSDIIIINKPAGLLSVPIKDNKSKSAKDYIEQILKNRGVLNKFNQPYVVHRLDRDTSGVMMFALNPIAQKKLTENWKTIVKSRLYRAVAENPLNPKYKLEKTGTIDEKLAKNSYHVGYVPKDDKNLKTVEAKTHYTIIQEGKTHTLFELSLETGKKNQIRAHLASKKYILAGDNNYKANTNPFSRLALHARTLEFYHPSTNKLMKFEIPEPKQWEKFVLENKTSFIEKKIQKPLKQEFTSNKNMRHLDFIQQGKLKGK